MHKQILLLSDTHSFLDPSIETYIRKSDEVWHAGDIGNVSVVDQINSWNSNFMAVFGNIDGHEIRAEYPLYHYWTYGKHKVLMIHIAGSIGKYNAKTRSLIEKYTPTILVCGHSHILKVKKDERYNLLYMNPGASGHHGFHKFRTVLQFQLTKDSLNNLNAIELGKRGRS
jgi:hypothetical protein